MALIRLNACVDYLDHYIKMLTIEIRQEIRKRAKHILILSYNRRCIMRDTIRHHCERMDEFLFMVAIKDDIQWTPAIVKGMQHVINSFLTSERTKMETDIASVKTLDFSDKVAHELQDTEPTLEQYIKTHPMPPAGMQPLPPPTAPKAPPSEYIRTPKARPTRV